MHRRITAVRGRSSATVCPCPPLFRHSRDQGSHQRTPWRSPTVAPCCGTPRPPWGRPATNMVPACANVQMRRPAASGGPTADAVPAPRAPANAHHDTALPSRRPETLRGWPAGQCHRPVPLSRPPDRPAPARHGLDEVLASSRGRRPAGVLDPASPRPLTSSYRQPPFPGDPRSNAGCARRGARRAGAAASGAVGAGVEAQGADGIRRRQARHGAHGGTPEGLGRGHAGIRRREGSRGG